MKTLVVFLILDLKRGHELLDKAQRCSADCE